MNRRVFLSYAHRDKQFVQHALAFLKQSHVLSRHDNVFLDVASIKPGQSFARVLRKNMLSADTVLVFWTEAAAVSNSVVYELGMADALGKEMVVAYPAGKRTVLPVETINATLVEVPDA
jgi:nucleoside 2-deoxyribosyltransferase